MCDTSDPSLLEAVTAVRSDAMPETFVVLSYTSKTKLGVVATGDGSAFAAMEEMGEDKVSYALLRVGNTRDQESKTVKFVFVAYTGPSVGGMARARVNTHKAAVKALMGNTHVDVQTDDMDDLSEAALTEKLKKASGANYVRRHASMPRATPPPLPR